MRLSKERYRKLFHLKGHGNEADFLGFLQKLVPHESLTLPRAVPILALSFLLYKKHDARHSMFLKFSCSFLLKMKYNSRYSFSNVCFCSLCKEHNARHYVPKYLTFLSLVHETQFPLLCVFLSPSRMSASVPCARNKCLSLCS